MPLQRGAHIGRGARTGPRCFEVGMLRGYLNQSSASDGPAFWIDGGWSLVIGRSVCCVVPGASEPKDSGVGGDHVENHVAGFQAGPLADQSLSAAALMAAFEQFHRGLLLVDPELRIRFANQGERRILARSDALFDEARYLGFR